MGNDLNRRLRVAHVYRDKAGNIHSREGWMANVVREIKPTITVTYADSGEIAEVLAGELCILGVVNNSKIMVEHIDHSDVNAKARRGYIVNVVKENKIRVLLDGDSEPVDLPVHEISLIGQLV